MIAPEFRPWPKTPRLFRDVCITEKIDGTNAAVGFTYDGVIWAQSRKRLIEPDDDNFGFAAWAWEHSETLFLELGPGLHYGEWWGSGIQRGYGLTGGEKRFSLFNADRHAHVAEAGVPGLGVVPVLYRGPFDTQQIAHTLDNLEGTGSVAAPGFANPEGIVVFHAATRQVFKVLLDNDALPKGVAA